MLSRNICFLVCILAAAVGAIAFCIRPSYTAGTLGGLLFIAVVLAAVFVFKEEDCPFLKKNFFVPTTLFLIGFYIVHFQVAVDLLLQNVSADDVFLFADEAVIVPAAALSVASIGSFLAGYFVKRNSVILSKGIHRVYPLSGLILFLCAIFIVFYLTTDKRYFEGVLYGNLNDSAGTYFTYLLLLLDVVFYSVPILHCRNYFAKGLKPNVIQFVVGLGLFNVVLLVYLFLTLLSGDRGPILTHGIVYFGSYIVASGRRLKVWQIAVLALLGAFVFTLLGVTRVSSRYFNEGSFVGKVKYAWERILEKDVNSYSFSPYTQELAGSSRVVCHAIYNVPDHYPYTYGVLTTSQVMAAVPTAGRWLHFAGLAPYSGEYFTGADRMSWIIQQQGVTYGDGTTCEIDFYLDFGLIGVILGMFLLGMMMRYADVNLYSPGAPLFLSVLSMVLLAKGVYIARSNFLYEWRFIVWAFLLLLIYQFFASGFSSTKQQKRGAL